VLHLLMKAGCDSESYVFRCTCGGGGECAECMVDQQDGDITARGSAGQQQ
jgi:hypothetical protein